MAVPQIKLPSRRKLVKQLTDELSDERLFGICASGGILYLLALGGFIAPERSARFMAVEDAHKKLREDTK
jgi:hypothetical protein